MVTSPVEELLTEVDIDDNVIGSIPRSAAHKSGHIYRNIMVLVKNPKGQILIQQRSSGKDLYPGCWDLSVGGHVAFGSTYPETAVREINEELGLAIEESDLVFVGKILVKLPWSRENFHVYEYSLKPIDRIRINPEEISQTAWMSLEDIKKSMESKTLEWYARPIAIITSLY